MAKVEKNLDIYYTAIGNTNAHKQENEFATIMKKLYSAGWKLISTSTAIVDTKKKFSNLQIFLEKNSNNYCRYLFPYSSILYISETPHTLISDN